MKQYTSVIFLLTIISMVNAQITYTTFNSSGNWSTDGGATDCLCSPVAGATNHIVVNHNSCTIDLTFVAGCFTVSGLSAGGFASITVNSGGAFYINGGFNSGAGHALQDVTINSGGELYVNGSSQYEADVNLTVDGVMTQNGGSNFRTNNWIINGTMNISGPSNCQGCDINGSGLFGTCTSLMASTFITPPLIKGVDETGNDICASPLPIELGTFNGKRVGRNSELDWTTFTESNNAYFVIERSEDFISFIDVGKVAGQSNSVKKYSYTFTDKNAPNNVLYYRLRQVDTDSSFSYSQIIALTPDPNPFGIYPNPVNDKLFLTGAKGVKYELIDQQGHLVHSSIIVNEELDMSYLTNGVYLIKLTSDELQDVKKIVVTH